MLFCPVIQSFWENDAFARIDLYRSIISRFRWNFIGREKYSGVIIFSPSDKHLLARCHWEAGW
jgi:hypothetical protein